MSCNRCFYTVPPEEAGARLPRYFSLLLNMNLLLQWPVFAFVCVYHRELVHTVFGEKFVDHSWLLPLIVGFTLVDIVANPVTFVAQYQEKAATLLLSKVFGIYNVIAMLVMLPVWGLRARRSRVDLRRYFETRSYGGEYAGRPGGSTPRRHSASEYSSGAQQFSFASG